MSRETFVVYRSELKMLAALPPDETVAALQALAGETPPAGLSPIAQAVLEHIEGHAETDKERYEQRKNSNAERARKYRERKRTEKEEVEERHALRALRVTPVTPVTHNGNDNVNVNGNGKDNGNVNENDNGEEETSSSSSEQAEGMKKKKKKKMFFGMDGDVFRFADHTHITREGFKEAWNRTMEDSRIPCIREMTEERWLLACSLMERFSLADIDHGLRRAKRSPKLNGSGGEGYVATFDWLLQPRNFLKCLEGNYG